MKTESEKQTEKLNKNIASRCSVKLLSKEEATEAILRPIIAAGREQETRERHERLLNACNNARKQNQEAKDLKSASVNLLNKRGKQLALREDGEDCSTGNPDFSAKKEPVKKVNITIPQFWQMTARDYHEFKNMEYYYECAGLNVEYEEIGCSGDYYAIFWIGKKPIKEINAAKATFEVEE